MIVDYGTADAITLQARLIEMSRYWRMSERRWEAALVAELKSIGARLEQLVREQPADRVTLEACNRYDSDVASLAKNRAEDLELLRPLRAAYVLAWAVLGLFVVPRVSGAPSCVFDDAALMIAMVGGLVTAVLLWPFIAAGGSLLIGRVDKASEALARVKHLLSRQYLQTPTLTIAMWAFMLFALASSTIRFHYEPVVTADGLAVVTVRDRFTGSVRIGRFTDNDCYSEHQERVGQ